MKQSPLVPVLLALLVGAGATVASGTTLAAAPLHPLAAPQQGAVAFVDVNVIPMNTPIARVFGNQTVIVRDGRIAAVGPTASTEVPRDALRVDGRQKFLIPGLAEMHGHVPGPQNPQLVEDVLFLYVAAGATTVRGMQGNPSQIELRRRIESGKLIGPRLFLAAPQMNDRSVPDVATARRLVREAKSAGFDLLKIQEGLSPEVYAAIVATAREEGIPFGGHVPDAVGVSGALQARQTTIDHLDNYLDALEAEDSPVRSAAPQVRARQLPFHVDERKMEPVARATREAGVAVVPTMALWEVLRGARAAESMTDRPELRYMPRATVDTWIRSVNDTRAQANAEAARREVEIRNRMLKALYDAGVEILMGTDAPQIFSVPGFSLHRELPIMVAAGMSTWSVLRSGTINVARHLGIQRDAGTIEPGKWADMLLLEANPLDDINNVQRRAGVMARGRWLPESAIQQRLREIAARNAG